MVVGPSCSTVDYRGFSKRTWTLDKLTGFRCLSLPSAKYEKAFMGYINREVGIVFRESFICVGMQANFSHGTQPKS